MYPLSRRTPPAGPVSATRCRQQCFAQSERWEGRQHLRPSSEQLTAFEGCASASVASSDDPNSCPFFFRCSSRPLPTACTPPACPLGISWLMVHTAVAIGARQRKWLFLSRCTRRVTLRVQHHASTCFCRVVALRSTTVSRAVSSGKP